MNACICTHMSSSGSHDEGNGEGEGGGLLPRRNRGACAENSDHSPLSDMALMEGEVGGRGEDEEECTGYAEGIIVVWVGRVCVAVCYSVL